jgi:hypothetical protein
VSPPTSTNTPAAAKPGAKTKSPPPSPEEAICLSLAGAAGPSH